MVASRSGTTAKPALADLPISEPGEAGRQRLVAAGGILGALAASSCCILPLALFMLGISGAWIGNLTALAPYQAYSLAITAAFLGVGYYLVYRRPKATCAEGQACARPLPNRIVKLALWTATVIARGVIENGGSNQ